MNWFNEYIRNIAYILVFVSFLGIIIPGEKYKEYIKLVTGVVVIIVVISPVGKVLKGSSQYSDILSKLEFELNYAVQPNRNFSYEDNQALLIIEEYRKALENQLFSQLNSLGYELKESELDISQGENDFGVLNNMSLVLKKTDTQNSSAGLIKIDKISVESWGLEAQKNQNEDNEEIINIKNYISSFYNLSVDNIHILYE